MICPKCGRNIEGNRCPYCEAPEIDDNTDEYNKRRSAYEESLRSEEADESDASDTPRRKFGKRHIAVVLTVIGAALTAAIVTTHLPEHFDGELFYTSEGTVKQITGSGSGEEKSGALLSSDGKSVYTEVGFSGQMTQALASVNGEYFARCDYEEASDGAKYSLYVQDKNSRAVTALSSDKAISLKAVTDSGEVIYLTSDVLNDQWYMGETNVGVFKITGTSGDQLTGENKAVSSGVSALHIYEASDTLICLRDDGTLFSCRISNPDNKTQIADGVSKVLAEKYGENNRFEYSNSSVNTSKDADLLMFYADRGWVLTDPGMHIYLSTGTTDEAAEFIYADSDRLLYKYDNGSLSRAVVADTGLTSYEELASVDAPDDLLWDEKTGSCIYVNVQGELGRARANDVNIISTGVIKNSLKKVYNDSGYVFSKDDGLYYAASFSGNPARISDEAGFPDVSAAAAYKGRVYVLAGKTLYGGSKKGGISQIDSCDGLYVVSF